MSGWDQKYDFEEWTRAIQDEAHSLQRSNKQARWIYVICAVAFTLCGIIFDFPIAIGVGVFFVLLFVFNELLIRRLRKAGIK